MAIKTATKTKTKLKTTKKTQTQKPKKTSVQLVVTIIWLVALVVNIGMYFWPQCPANFTQAQVDLTHCNVGANIGVGLMAILITMPLTTVVAGMWLVTYTVRFVRSKK